MDTEFDEPAFVHQHCADRANAYMVVEQSKALPLLVALTCMAMLIAGISLGIGLWALSYADKARMESRILQVKVEGFEKALWAAKIDPTPHLPGQPE